MHVLIQIVIIESDKNVQNEWILSGMRISFAVLLNISSSKRRDYDVVYTFTGEKWLQPDE